MNNFISTASLDMFIRAANKIMSEYTRVCYFC